MHIYRKKSVNFEITRIHVPCVNTSSRAKERPPCSVLHIVQVRARQSRELSVDDAMLREEFLVFFFRLSRCIRAWRGSLSLVEAVSTAKFQFATVQMFSRVSRSLALRDSLAICAPQPSLAGSELFMACAALRVPLIIYIGGSLRGCGRKGIIQFGFN